MAHTSVPVCIGPDTPTQHETHFKAAVWLKLEQINQSNLDAYSWLGRRSHQKEGTVALMQDTGRGGLYRRLQIFHAKNI